jgi:hypothetical protein
MKLGCVTSRLSIVDLNEYFQHRLPVQLNVFSYDENTFTEGKYKKVNDIPSVPLTAMSSMQCMYDKRKTLDELLRSMLVRMLS